MANIYKTFTKQDLDNRQASPTSNAENQSMTSILNKFVELFKINHL